MKNYNKILEAINRGIQLALDDFEDNEVLNIKSKQILNRDYTKEYLDLMNEVVDLGLPSGTLWCKYNLDVDPNLLSKAEDWYGKYYAWAELKANKDTFNWSKYKFKKYDKLTKYCINSEYSLNSFTDNLTELLPEDDVAYLTKKLHNYKFHIPTVELCEELKNHTTNYWVNNYDPNKLIHNPEDDGEIQGLNGRVFEGKNRNLLFIPAAGYHVESAIASDGINSNLWSSSLKPEFPNNAYYIGFNSFNINIYYIYRYFGFTIRPVINL